MRTVKGNSTIAAGLKVQFEKEITSFAKQLNAFVNGETQYILGSAIEPKMPTTNTQEILEKFIKLGTEQLQSEGVRKMRAQAVAKHTFNELLSTVMNEVEGSLQ